jgi:hypothetical protein
MEAENDRDEDSEGVVDRGAATSKYSVGGLSTNCVLARRKFCEVSCGARNIMTTRSSDSSHEGKLTTSWTTSLMSTV